MQRDFVTQKSSRFEYKGEKTWVLLNRSVKHPKIPEFQGYVRGHSYGTGNLIRLNEKGETIVTYCAQADLKGWIPPFVVSMVTTMTAPSMMQRLENACKNFDEWKKENPGEDKVLYTEEGNPPAVAQQVQQNQPTEEIQNVPN